MLEGQDNNYEGVSLSIICSGGNYGSQFRLGFRFNKLSRKKKTEWAIREEPGALSLLWYALGVLALWRTMACKNKLVMAIGAHGARGVLVGYILA